MSCLVSCSVVALALLIPTAYHFLCYSHFSTALGSSSPLYTVSFVVHAGIACLVSLAYDWLLLIGAYSKVPIVSLAMIGCYL